MGFENIIFEKDKGIAKIIINRPEKRNALKLETRREMALYFAIDALFQIH